MYECVNKYHPDKVADRIAGAIVDLAYKKNENPKVAVEVLLGHGKCLIINETDTNIKKQDVLKIVKRIAGLNKVEYKEVRQDKHLAKNQCGEIRCGDNGVFKGSPVTKEQKELRKIAKYITNKYPYDGKYILDGDKLIICQSNVNSNYLKWLLRKINKNVIINPLGDWTGGSNVDSGATNRKLGSDMADSVTGGGLHGKDLSKADVSLNIYCWLEARKFNREVSISCAIGDSIVDGKSYKDIVEIARKYIKSLGGFEKFAEWGYKF